MKQTKKYIASLLAIIMLFSSIATTVFAEGTEPSLEPPVNQETQEQLENQELLEEDLQLDDNALNQIPENEELSSQEVVDEEEKPPEENNSSEENQPLEENLPSKEDPVEEQPEEETPPEPTIHENEIINVEFNGEIEVIFEDEPLPPSGRLLKSRGGMSLMGNGTRGNGAKGGTNVPGDTAEKAFNPPATEGTFRWVSIPGGYVVGSANNYALVDHDGEAHLAFCIDANKPNGVLQEPGVSYIGSINDIRSWALYAMHLYMTTSTGAPQLRTNTSVTTYVPEQTYRVVSGGGYETHTVPAMTLTGVVRAADKRMGMRWIGWTGGSPTPENSSLVRQDMVNLMSGALPTLYAVKVERQSQYYVNSALVTEWESTSTYISDESKSSFRHMQIPMGEGEWIDNYTRMSSRVLTPSNYTSLLDSGARTAYRNILNSIAKKGYDTIMNIARAYNGAIGYLWDGPSARYQRFLTFNYIKQPQPVNFELQKVSTNTDCTNGNANYSLEGIKYEIRRSDNNALITTLTLDATGHARYEVPLDQSQSLIGISVYAIEVNDDVRKASGYAYNGNRITLTLTQGDNFFNAEDTPLMDPVNIIINKVDNDTGESYDKIGI